MADENLLQVDNPTPDFSNTEQGLFVPKPVEVYSEKYNRTFESPSTATEPEITFAEETKAGGNDERQFVGAADSGKLESYSDRFAKALDDPQGVMQSLIQGTTQPLQTIQSTFLQQDLQRLLSFRQKAKEGELVKAEKLGLERQLAKGKIPRKADNVPNLIRDLVASPFVDFDQERSDALIKAFDKAIVNQKRDIDTFNDYVSRVAKINPTKFPLAASIGSGVSQGGLIVASVGGAALLKLPVLSAVSNIVISSIFANQEGVKTTQSSLDKGEDIQTALDKGRVQAVFQFSIDAISNMFAFGMAGQSVKAGKIAKDITAKTVVASAVKSTVTETTGEVTQEVGGLGIDKAFGLNDAEFEDFVRTGIDTAIVSIVSFGAVSAPFSIVEASLQKKGLNKKQSKQLTDVIKQSSPDILQAATEILENTNSSPKTGKPQTEQEMDLSLQKIEQTLQHIESGVLDTNQLSELAQEAGIPLTELEKVTTKLQKLASDVGTPRVVTKGRQKQLSSEIKTLDQKIVSEKRKLSALNKQDIPKGKKAAEKLLKQIKTSEDKLASLTDQVSGLEGQLSEVDNTLSTDTISTTAGDVSKLTAKAQQKAITAVNRVARETKRQTLTSVAQIQKQFNALLKAGKLSDKDSAKFDKAKIRALTPEQFQLQLPEIVDRIVKLKEKEFDRAFKKKFDTFIKSIESKKGTRTAQIQEVLNSVLKTNAGTRQTERAETAYKELLVNPTAAQSTEEVITRKAIVFKTNPNSFSLAEKEQFLQDLVEFEQTGKVERLKDLAKKQTKQKKIFEFLSTELDVALEFEKSIGSINNKVRNSISSFFSSTSNLLFEDYEVLLQNLFSPKTQASRDLTQLERAKPFVEQLSLAKEITESNRLANILNKKVGKFMEDIFGSESKVQDRLKKDSKKQIQLGKFKFTKSQMRSFLMMRRNPDTEIILEKANELTPNLFAEMELRMDEADNALMDFIMGGLLTDIYKDVSEVFARQNGFNPPFNEIYFPTSREGVSSKSITNDFLIESYAPSSSVPTFTKSREESIAPIIPKNDTDVLFKYIRDATHYIAVSEKFQDINATVRDGKIQKAITDVRGKSFKNVFNGALEAAELGHRDIADGFSKVFLNVQSNIVSATLGLSPKIMATQLTSSFIAITKIGHKDFSSGVLDLILNPKNAIDTLSKSTVLELRAAVQDTQTIITYRESVGAAFRVRPTWKQLALLNVRLGDRGGILIGGWPVYKSVLKQTGSKDKALAAFEEFISGSQQSSDINRLSDFQRTITGRIVGSYMSSLISMSKGNATGIRQFSRGQISAAQLAKVLMVYHVYVPLSYTAIRTIGSPTVQTLTTAAFVGTLVPSTPVIGNLITALVALLVSGGDEKEDTFETNIPIYKEIRDIERQIDKLDNICIDDLAEGLDIIINHLAVPLAEGATGIPIENAIDIMKGVNDIIEGETGDGAKKITGFSSFQIEQSKKDVEEEKDIGSVIHSLIQ